MRQEVVRNISLVTGGESSLATLFRGFSSYVGHTFDPNERKNILELLDFARATWPVADQRTKLSILDSLEAVRAGREEKERAVALLLYLDVTEGVDQKEVLDAFFSGIMGALKDQTVSLVPRCQLVDKVLSLSGREWKIPESCERVINTLLSSMNHIDFDETRRNEVVRVFLEKSQKEVFRPRDIRRRICQACTLVIGTKTMYQSSKQLAFRILLDILQHRSHEPRLEEYNELDVYLCLNLAEIVRRFPEMREAAMDGLSLIVQRPALSLPLKNELVPVCERLIFSSSLDLATRKRAGQFLSMVKSR